MSELAPSPLISTAAWRLKLRLPWPPSVNHYWRFRIIDGRPRLLTSTQGKRYRREVQSAVGAQCGALDATQARLAVLIELFPPDRIRRDIDNLQKAVLDALTHSGVWADDSQIDRLLIVRRAVLRPGWIDVTIQKHRAAATQQEFQF